MNRDMQSIIPRKGRICLFAETRRRSGQEPPLLRRLPSRTRAAALRKGAGEVLPILGKTEQSGLCDEWDARITNQEHAKHKPKQNEVLFGKGGARERVEFCWPLSKTERSGLCDDVMNENEILRYMGQRTPADGPLKQLIKESLDELASCADARHVCAELPVKVEKNEVILDELRITSAQLARRLEDCSKALIFAATLGAGVDRAATRNAADESAKAVCFQACASALIEDYCNEVQRQLASDPGAFLTPRFSPGYEDFDIKHQTDILRILQADKKIGLTQTDAHMLVPLKSVTAIIGVRREQRDAELDKCAACDRLDCNYRAKED